MSVYRISEDGRSITCGRCGLTSYSRGDIDNRYCGNCHRFHDDAAVWACRDCHGIFGYPAGKTPNFCPYCRSARLIDQGQHMPRWTPGYWMYETTGVLRPAVESYLAGGSMTPQHIAAMRAYLRQWINADWAGDVEQLRRLVDQIDSRSALEAWLDAADELGVDPL